MAVGAHAQDGEVEDGLGAEGGADFIGVERAGGGAAACGPAMEFCGGAAVRPAQNGGKGRRDDGAVAVGAVGGNCALVAYPEMEADAGGVPPERVASKRS